MNFLKCPNCGGVILQTNGLNYECYTCGKTFGPMEVQNYKERTDFFEKNIDVLVPLMNRQKITELVNLINAALDQYCNGSEDDYYVKYELEYALGFAYIKCINSFSKILESNPYSSEAYIQYINLNEKLTDIIYYIVKETNKKLDYSFIMGYATNRAIAPMFKIYNGIVEEWNRYDHEEDKTGRNEFETACSYIVRFGSILDKYGDVWFQCYYDFLIKVCNSAMFLTYQHRYWIGDYLATQNIGLTDEAKSIWQEDLDKFREKSDRIQRKVEDINRKREQEERERKEKEKRERIEKFWNENQELKTKLENEKEECAIKIKEITEQISLVNADKEINELKEEVSFLKETLNTLGFFAMKQKKEKNDQISKLSNEILKLNQDVRNKKAELNAKISKFEKRINEIENEFTRDR